jgi:serine/threonine protein kinase
MRYLEKYTLAERIHEGTATVVHRGRRNDDGANVVLKILKEEYPSTREIARLRHEHAILAELQIAGVVKTYGLENCGTVWRSSWKTSAPSRCTTSSPRGPSI